MNAHHLKHLRTAVAALTLAFSAAACGGGGGGGGGSTIGSNPLPPQPQSAPPTLTEQRFGLAMFGDDSYSTGFLQVVSLFDSNGGVLATPVMKTVPFPFMYDYEDMSIAPDGSHGLVADGARTLRVVNGISTGNTSVSSYTLDISPYGNDLDSVRVLPNGDEAVVSTDTSNTLLIVSGLLNGTPKAAEQIATPDLRNGLALSADGKVLLARGYSGVTVYSIADSAPAQGALGGWTYHTFTQTQNLTTIPALDAADARAGMALSPVDSSRGVVVGAGPSIVLLTGLPASASAQAPVTINGATNAYAAAISPDGTTAFVGTDKGIAVFNGINTGTLAQVQSVTIPAGNGDTLQQITTLGVTPDGAHVVAVGRSTLAPSGTNGYLVVLPFTNGTLGAPVGMLSGVAVPDDDQIVVQ